MSTTSKGKPRQLTDEQRAKMRAQNRYWHRRNRERSRERHRVWLRDNAERAKQKDLEWRVRTLYGLSIQQYRSLGWTCFICGNVSGAGRRRLHIDHDHATGHVRGLLCSNCNTALGGFRDNQYLLKRALEYLVRCQGAETDEEVA